MSVTRVLPFSLDQWRKDQEEDLSFSMRRELEACFDKFVLDLPCNIEPLVKSLTLFSQEYTGQLPLEGIRVSHVKEISSLYRIFYRAIGIAVTGNQRFLRKYRSAIKILLLREAGRNLLRAVAESPFFPHSIQITSGDQPMTISRYEEDGQASLIVSIPENDLLLLDVHANRRWTVTPVPFTAVFAHELLHIIIPVLTTSPATVKGFPSVHEQVAITGYRRLPSHEDVREEDYFPINEYRLFGSFHCFGQGGPRISHNAFCFQLRPSEDSMDGIWINKKRIILGLMEKGDLRSCVRQLRPQTLYQSFMSLMS